MGVLSKVSNMPPASQSTQKKIIRQLLKAVERFDSSVWLHRSADYDLTSKSLYIFTLTVRSALQLVLWR